MPRSRTVFACGPLTPSSSTKQSSAPAVRPRDDTSITRDPRAEFLESPRLRGDLRPHFTRWLITRKGDLDWGLHEDLPSAVEGRGSRPRRPNSKPISFSRRLFAGEKVNGAIAIGTRIKDAVEAPEKGPEEDGEQHEHGGDREHAPPYPDVGLSSRRLLDRVALTTSSVTHG